LEFFLDGAATATDSIALTALQNPTNEFALEYSSCSSAVQFNTISVKVSGTGYAEIHSIDLIYSPLYDQPGDVG
jgi:hypothetical protein